MNSRFEVRFAQVNDYAEINNLFNKTFEKQRTLEQFLWKFSYSCRAESPPVAVLCLIESRIIGSFGMLPHRLSVFGEIVDAIQVVDVCVDPAFRGHGVNRVSVEFFLREAGPWGRLAFGFPGAFYSSIGFLRLGYRSVCPFILLGLTSQNPQYSRSRSGDDRYRRQQSDHISEEQTEFLTEHERTRGICTHRTSDYLKWRYSASSGQRFTFFTAKKGSLIEGLAITRTLNDSPHVTVWIYELLALSSQAVIELLEAIAASIDSKKKFEIMFWCNDQYPWQAELADTGFRRMEGGPADVVGMPLGASDPSIERCFDPSNWFLTLGDSDL